MAKVEVKIDKNDGSTYTVDKFNGLKSVQSLSQSTGQPKEIYYGVVPSSGQVNMVDVNGDIKSMIINNEIDNTNVNISVYSNDNLVHNHKSADSEYSEIGKTFSIQMTDVLEQWDTLQYNGYSYAGSSATAYNMLVSVLQSFGFDETTQIPNMLREVATILKAITISKPFLGRDTYRATIDKFCQLAQMQVFQADDGSIKFISGRPNRTTDGEKIIEIPVSDRLTQLKESIILKNKYDAVDIIPAYIVVDNSDTIPSTQTNPSDKELTDTINGVVNNSSSGVEIEATGVLVRGEWNEGWVYPMELDRSEARIEVFYLTGEITVDKPADSQYTDFRFATQMSGREYSNFTFKNDWQDFDTTTLEGLITANDGSTISSTIYSSASVPSSGSNWSGETIAEGVPNCTSSRLTLNFNSYKEGEGSAAPEPNSISIQIPSGYYVVEEGTYYKIGYRIPTGFFMIDAMQSGLGVDSYQEEGQGYWSGWYPENVHGLIRQANSLTISITANTLYKKDLDSIRVGNGSNVYTYGNNELLAVDESVSMSLFPLVSQHYKNAQNIIKDYKKGISDGSISVVCGDYYSLEGDLVKDWSNGEIIETGDIVKINDKFYNVSSRHYKYSGVPKLDLELQDEFPGGFCKLNFTGIDENGKYEGQIDFDGTIVAYAVGKPNIIFVNGSESISYPYCNGLDGNYYNYDFSISNTTSPKQIIEDNVFIPSYYKGKPVTRVLQNAFFGRADFSILFPTNVYQGYFIKSIILGGNITQLGLRCFQNTIRPGKLYLPKSLRYCSASIANTYQYKIGGVTKTVYVRSNISKIGNANEGIYEKCTNVIFDSNVTALSGLLFQTNAPSNLVFNHSQSAQISLDNITAPSSARSITIYSDNTIVNNFNWASKNITATIKPLSEWVEE